jgi:hypothetical protein
MEKDIELVDSVMKGVGVWSHKREAWSRIKTMLQLAIAIASQPQPVSGDWACSGCGRHFAFTVAECPHCRAVATVTTAGT